jgi:hypothetical protein
MEDEQPGGERGEGQVLVCEEQGDGQAQGKPVAEKCRPAIWFS